jgi:DUF1680 family protein
MKSAFFILSLLVCLACEAKESFRRFATVEPVGLADARWTDGFWHDRFELCRTNLLPDLGRIMEGTNYSQFFRNFEIAAGMKAGRYRGAPFNDGELYKLIQAASAAYAIEPDDYFRRNLDRAIDVIARAQRADGYLHTPVLVAIRNGDTNAAPFKDRQNFEMYNMGHLFTAACVHHQATGETNLLAVAVKAADFLCRTFANSTPEAARSSVCPSHYMGIIDLYRETGDRRYLELAGKFFALRAEITDGGDDNQDRIPFERQTEAVGHAVRANYLYAGAADLFMETGDTNIWKPLEPIWENLTEKKMYITGGCGALFDGASPYGSKDQKNITRTHQAYGHDYELPNAAAHNETCANIGNVMWNWRMFLATGEARFLDVAELALYNSVLSGVSLDGTNFFYTNPLRVTDPMPLALRWPRTRVPFLSSFCCPPNLARTIAGSSQFAYAKSADAIWVNLYGGSELETELSGAGKVKLAQETEYPWSGRVRIKILSAPQKEFSLKLRIPGWAKDAAVRLNLQPAQAAGAGSYFEIRRPWQAGDIVDLDLPMPVRMMQANPLVEETANQVAFQRGPVVYCLESPDMPKGVKISDVRIPANIQLRARFDRRLLDGVVVLEGQVLTRAGGAWDGQLYREARPEKFQTSNAKFIPYSVWQNRGPSEMSVWLPLAPQAQ